MILKRTQSFIQRLARSIKKTELGYDSDLVIDSDDEKKLDLMPELKREQEIDERRKKREILIARYEFVKK